MVPDLVWISALKRLNNLCRPTINYIVCSIRDGVDTFAISKCLNNKIIYITKITNSLPKQSHSSHTSTYSNDTFHTLQSAKAHYGKRAYVIIL